MIDNAWTVGWERLKKDDVKPTRYVAAKRLKRKRMVSRAISKVGSKNEQQNMLVIKPEIEIAMPKWTEHAVNMFPEFYLLN